MALSEGICNSDNSKQINVLLGITKHISLCTSKKVQVIFILVLTEFVLQFEQQQNETFCQGLTRGGKVQDVPI